MDFHWKLNHEQCTGIHADIHGSDKFIMNSYTFASLFNRLLMEKRIMNRRINVCRYMCTVCFPTNLCKSIPTSWMKRTMAKKRRKNRPMGSSSRYSYSSSMTSEVDVSWENVMLGPLGPNGHVMYSWKRNRLRMDIFFSNVPVCNFYVYYSVYLHTTNAKK